MKNSLLLFVSLYLLSCGSSTQEKNHPFMSDHRHTNSLIHETSPYLLQHAHNPVDWYPWGKEALEKAKKENKLILVSIGYSACHWCHVMERESFEDTAVAELMNRHFVCIKVDREERPDIDQVYMNAVQLMTGSGGWPLNCFALPDGRPIYGGTYFPKQQFMSVLTTLSDIYKNEPGKVLDYADQLTEGVQKSELVKLNTEKPEFTMDTLKKMVDAWKERFDNVEGGPRKAPKFPLPNNYEFLLHYYHATKDEALLKHITLTLRKMAWGGIYDQLGGGFARYSTDTLWKAPHFEKMLYDNAQLVTLYCEAYRFSKDPLYRDVVYETLEFIRREMTSPEGAFYSALDADSEGEEGRFYVWTKEELHRLLGDDFNLFADYYNINQSGLWEHGNYILLRNKTDEAVAGLHGISASALREKITAWKQKLMAVRDQRVRPGLDDKTLTSWNALMLKAYADAYNTFGEAGFLEAALRNARFILHRQKRSDGGLNHNYKSGRSNINGYLEDYSFTIEGFMALYEASLDEQWLNEARALADYSIRHFYDKQSGMFWFTSDQDDPLIARKMEVTDNVIPSSNSSMARALFLLGNYFDSKEYLSISKQMLNNVRQDMAGYGSGYSNWARLMLWNAAPFYEVAVVGNSVDEKRRDLLRHYLPNMIFAGSRSSNKLPLLEDKYVEGKTLIYVCEHRACQLPVNDAEEAIKLMK
jgi:uncharacterized protein YyaL (SSP411 family)